MIKNKKNILLLASGGMLLGVIVIFICMVISGFDMTRFNTNETNDSPYREKSYKADASKNISKITVNLLDRDVNVISSDKEQISITYYENKKEKYEISDNGESLSLQYIKSKKLSDHFNFFSWTDANKMMDAITIEVPKSYTGELNLKNSSGSINVSDLTNLTNVSIKNTDNGVKLTNLTAQELTVKNSSGKIIVEDTIVSKDINLTNADATIQLNKVSAESNLTIKNSSGSIIIESATINQSMKLKNLDNTIDLSNVTVREDGTIENSSGSIKLSNVSAVKSILCKSLDAPIEFTQLTAPSIQLNNSSGTISGDIIGKMSDYQITSSSGDGRNNLPTDKKTGEKRLKAKTMNSYIEIEFTED